MQARREYIHSDTVLLSVLVLALPVLRASLMFATDLELHFDEAQYWEWSQRLDWSYYSKGPLVAWLIALSTKLLGHGEWQVRLFAWVANAAFLLVLFYFVLDVWKDRQAAWWAVLFGLTTPVYFALGQVMSTDPFLFLFWTWGLWAAYRALHRQQRLAWYELGTAVGLGSLTKLSIGLLPFVLGLILLFSEQGREELRRFPPWGGAFLALLLLSPVLLWNASHDWVMFRHEQGHVGAPTLADGNLMELVLGQWIALSPIIAGLFAYVLVRRPSDPGERLLWLVSVLVLTLFLLKSMIGKVQPNWPAPAYIGLLVLFAGHVPTFSKGMKWLLYGGIGVSILLLTVAFTPSAFGLAGDRDPFHELKRWRAPVREVAEQAPRANFLLTINYRLAGELAFYWPDRIPVYLTSSTRRRRDQHDLWPGMEREAGRNAAFVSTSSEPPAELASAFESCERLRPVSATTEDGTTLRRLYVWFCKQAQPVEWAKPVGF